MKRLSHEDRLRLMKFVCSFVWADLRVHDKEKAFVRRMAKDLSLDAREKDMVEKWLETPPRAAEVDPNKIPKEHRKLFLDTCRAAVAADGHIDAEERINLALLEELLQ